MSTIIEKQPTIHRLFSTLIQKNTMQHAYLFEGLPGVGKKEMALWVTKALFCAHSDEGGSPCGECYQCQRIDTHQHPDVIEIIPEGQSIKVDQVRQLKAEFSKSGVESTRKCFIIEDIEKMTINAANSLLKFLEEPDGDVTAFLLTSAKGRILPTILSRCQLVHFPTQPITHRIQELENRGISTAQASLLTRITQDADRAVELSEDEAFRERVAAVWGWFKLLSKKDSQAFIFVHTQVMKAAKSREEQRQLIELMIILYRDILSLYYNDSANIAFANQRAQLKQAASHLSSKQIAHILEYFLTGKKKLESNVQAQGIFEDISLQILSA